MKEFLNCYEASRFKEISFYDVLTAFYGPLLPKTDEKKQEEAAAANFISWVELEYPRVYPHVLKDNGIHTHYRKGRITDRDLKALDQALAKSPDSYEYLPVFSQRLTGNPHAFDSDTLLGQLFFRCIQIEGANADLSASEIRNMTYERFGIVLDNILNFVSVSGLLASQNDAVHPMWLMACKHNIVWNVLLKHLLEVDALKPCKGKKVLVIENSGLFSLLSSAYPQCAVVCTHGQINFAAWTLLQKLASDTTVYYASDFDPEGLLIAQKVKRRFTNRVNLQFMTLDLYEKSHPEVALTPQRLTQLSGIVVEELADVSEAMKRSKKAGYQEAITDVFLSWLQDNNK